MKTLDDWFIERLSRELGDISSFEISIIKRIISEVINEEEQSNVGENPLEQEN